MSEHVSGITKLWNKLPELDREAICNAIIGKMIVDIHPRTDLDGKGNEWLSGFDIAIYDPIDKHIRTIEIESVDAWRVGISIIDGYVTVGEEIMFHEGNEDN